MCSALASSGSILEPAGIGTVRHRRNFRHLLTEATLVAPLLPKSCSIKPIQYVRYPQNFLCPHPFLLKPCHLNGRTAYMTDNTSIVTPCLLHKDFKGFIWYILIPICRKLLSKILFHYLCFINSDITWLQVLKSVSAYIQFFHWKCGPKLLVLLA